MLGFGRLQLVEQLLHIGGLFVDELAVGGSTSVLLVNGGGRLLQRVGPLQMSGGELPFELRLGVAEAQHLGAQVVELRDINGARGHRSLGGLQFGQLKRGLLQARLQRLQFGGQLVASLVVRCVVDAMLFALRQQGGVQLGDAPFGAVHQQRQLLAALVLLAQRRH